MILRRIAEHVKAQNWTAVALDFLIVVFGVFMGIQLGNWNDARAFAAQEKIYLGELRLEITRNLGVIDNNRTLMMDVAVAAERALQYLESNQSCEDDCWERIIDVFHASQWVNFYSDRSVFTEMQRQGLPNSLEVEFAVETFYRQGDALTVGLGTKPVYRDLVRELLPLEAQKSLWADCHHAPAGLEYLSRDCSSPLSAETERETLERLRADPKILRTLTNWAGSISTIPQYLSVQYELGGKAIAVIDVELGEAP